MSRMKIEVHQCAHGARRERQEQEKVASGKWDGEIESGLAFLVAASRLRHCSPSFLTTSVLAIVWCKVLVFRAWFLEFKVKCHDPLLGWDGM